MRETVREEKERSQLKRSLSSLALLLVLVTYGVPALAQGEAGRAQGPSTVLDYFLRLPQEYLVNYPIGGSRREREAAITVRDLRNGFLQIGKPGEGESATVALFRKPDGRALIAVESNLCALKCEQKLFFLQYENGAWSDVTEEMLPRIDDRAVRARVERETKAERGIGPDNYAYQLLYKLPRTGTTIIVTENWSNKKVGELLWVTGKFTPKLARGK